MARRATGTVRVLRNDEGVLQWHAKWTRADRSRTPWMPIDPSIPLDDEPAARACAARLAPKIRAASENGGAGETVQQYAKRWLEGRSKRCVSEDRTRLAHAFRTIGHLPAATCTRDDMKRLVLALDADVQRGHTLTAEGKRRPFSWKTATCVFGTVQALFRDAQKSKQPELCIRDDNPTDGVAGPDHGVKKTKVYLWPSEFMKLVSCERIPMRWRRLFSLAVYTYARAGELAALEWGADVDLEHGTIHIHRSKDDQRKRGTAPTKAKAARRTPIETNLRPLLEAMHAEAGGKGHVVRLPADGLSRKLRMYLRRAGVDRADLFTTDTTRKAITFHDLRSTGITWAAIRGDEALRIMQRAGHADFETTQIYLREAENLSAGFGEVFPALPESLLGIAPQSPRAIRNARSPWKTSRSEWPLRDSNLLEETCEAPAERPDPVPETKDEASTVTPLYDYSQPAETETGPLSDAELERAIVEAVMQGLGDVARTLAAQLEDRRRSAPVVDLAARRRR